MPRNHDNLCSDITSGNFKHRSTNYCMESDHMYTKLQAEGDIYQALILSKPENHGDKLINSHLELTKTCGIMPEISGKVNNIFFIAPPPTFPETWNQFVSTTQQSVTNQQPEEDETDQIKECGRRQDNHGQVSSTYQAIIKQRMRKSKWLAKKMLHQI